MPWDLRHSQGLTIHSSKQLPLCYRPAQRNDALTRLLIGNPNPVPKKAWRKNKAHGPADAARLVSAEIAHRDLLAKEKAERAANRVGNHALEPADEEDPGLLPPSTATPKAGRIWQHEDDAWGDPGLCGATHGHQLLDLMAL